MQANTMNVMEGEVFQIISNPQTLCNINRIDGMEWEFSILRINAFIRDKCPYTAQICVIHKANKE